MNNLSIKYFHQQLITLINNSGLPVGTAYFIVKDILNELEKTYLNCAYKESQEDNIKEESQTIEIPEPILDKEETENEGTNTNASEYSGSVNDN